MRLPCPVPFDYSRLYEPGEKRTPTGSMTTLEAAAIAEPESWNYKVPYSNRPGYIYAQAYDYYLVRGFAVVEAGGIGTYGSEGFELCGFDLERDAHACVVEWLTGDRVAYTDPYNNIEIAADWSNGNVAMTGCSYGGTLPFEVATSGVKGLRTIIPFAGIASWYDYTNSQGAPLYNDAAYANSLAAYNSGAAFLDDDSGGGSCVVQNLSTAWGTSFNISAPRRMSFMKNGSLYDIDRGADPDYTISSPAKYYDRQALTDYINSLY